jgi:molybdate transport system substrate-binding protein
LTIVAQLDGSPVMAARDLAAHGVRIIAAGVEVPVTAYTDAVIAAIGRLPDAPAGFAEACAANVVSREDNVRAIVTKVALGEGDAGIVYVTDAAASDAVRVVEIPDEANAVATYAGVVVASSGHRAEARLFLDWLAGEDGGAVLAGHGFMPPADR